MPRISFPSPETMSDEQRAVYDDIVSGPRARLVGPLKAALHNPALADRWQKMGALLRFGTSIPPRHSELAILVAARRWNSQLEWAIHAVAAQVGGLPDEVTEAIRVCGAPRFSDAADAVVYEYARQLQQTGNVDDACYASVLQLYGEAGIVELGAIIGYYTMVAMTLNVHQIPMPEEHPEPQLEVRQRDGVAVLAELPPGVTVAQEAMP
ncbi:carboxymuconolactone decarboxylase family protein [Herbaspirillum sp. alder98]|uniref:carboxymuconolactone decarboxylase family protein n=1 Tax=Herbaspirillum sp. alder98 TaxID=2913096 RepID=UPI001CD89884|nr:carboxymuconolactone decarboxylase family protein [Herbaspirillum sp. alder98]MCA1325088.1 carboxymuconolactone decarboxylase family protein [Herbaspirillum sp. alder98]